jgi:diacylglycerol O-acyltransferase
VADAEAVPDLDLFARALSEEVKELLVACGS